MCTFEAELVHHDARLERVTGKSCSFRVLASGFRFLEGPVWDVGNNRLLFSDIPGNALYQWSESGGVSMVKPNSFLANGNAMDSRGRILTCEHGTSRVSMTDVDGSYVVLADRWDNAPLNSPNDIIVAPWGDVYFSDPVPGRCARVGIPRPAGQPFQGVYRINRRTAELILLTKDMAKPNGLCFSPDGRRLFVNDSDRGHIRVFAVDKNGNLADDGPVWATLSGSEPGVADGMKIDSSGMVWCCGPGGIHVFAGVRQDSGECVGLIRTSKVTANLAWGGRAGSSLFLAASDCLVVLDTAVTDAFYTQPVSTTA